MPYTAVDFTQIERFKTGDEFSITVLSDDSDVADILIALHVHGIIGLSGDDITVSVLFANPIQIPEPNYGAVFLTASGLLIWARKARRSKRA